MAKKKFNISSTLSKNKETKLAEKIPLKKTAKDIEIVKEKVEEIHPIAEEVVVAPPKAKVVKAVAPKPKVKIVEEKVKLVRMTIDTPEDMHKRLKIKSIERGISMRDYVLRLIEKELK